MIRFIPIILGLVLFPMPVQAQESQNAIRLTPQVAKLFEEYKSTFKPYYFAINKGGWSAGYTFCDNACRISNSKYQAIQYCELYSRGTPCEIFAVGTKIIWDGPIYGLKEMDNTSEYPTKSKTVNQDDWKVTAQKEYICRQLGAPSGSPNHLDCVNRLTDDLISSYQKVKSAEKAIQNTNKCDPSRMIYAGC